MVERRELVGVGDGHIAVEVLGRGEPVVVIQTALNPDELRPLCQHIARAGSYQVFHCHRRGYAGSTARAPGSVAGDAADAGAVISAMSAEPVHLVGASYSAAVALSLTCATPELVHTLTVVEPPPVGTPSAAEFVQANLTLLRSYEGQGAHAALEELMRMLVGEDWRDVSEHELPGSVEAMERDAPTFFACDIPALLSWRFDTVEAARIRCPVLYVGGARSSPWFTQMRARLSRLLPHVEEVTVEDAGHLVASTHPGEVAQLVLDHFGRHPTPDPA